MSEACGAQRLAAQRNAEVPLLLLLIPRINLSSSPSQGLCKQMEQHGDREEAQATSQGTDTDAVKAKHHAPPAKELPPSTMVLPSAR